MKEENAKDKIIRIPDSLVAQSAELVRRGLQDLDMPVPVRCKRILLAHHEEAINEVFGKILSTAEYEIRTTTHPSEVVALVAEFQPAVVLIALVAPEIGGIKLSQELSERFPTVKIVLMDDVKEEILQHLLEQGVNCDTLETPLERQELLDMMEVWVSGSGYIDTSSHLRMLKGEEHLGKLLNRTLRMSDWLKHGLSTFFVQILQNSSSDETLAQEPEFLEALGATLARFAQLGPPFSDGEGWFARFGFAYRNGESEFVVMSAWLNKKQACEVSGRLKIEIDSLLNHHRLRTRFFVSVALVSAPEDAQSGETILKEGRQLTLALNKTGHGGVALRRLANRKRILVSYEEAINEVFSEILSSSGHEVRTTKEPSEVIALAGNFEPDIALIQLIAKIDGLTLSQQLSARFSALKIVLLGTDDFLQHEKVQALIKSGAISATLKLPCERKELLDIVEYQ